MLELKPVNKRFAEAYVLFDSCIVICLSNYISFGQSVRGVAKGGSEVAYICPPAPKLVLQKGKT